jgi:hypothetical protein
LEKLFSTPLAYRRLERVEKVVKVVICFVEGGGGLQTVLQGLRGSRTSVNILLFVAYSTLSKFHLLPSLEKGFSPGRTSGKERNATKSRRLLSLHIALFRGFLILN